MQLPPQVGNPPFDPSAFHEFEHQGWQASAGAYSQYLSPLTSDAIDPLLDAVNAHSTTRLIDLATGPGHAAQQALMRGCDVNAVDFSDRMIELAKSIHSPGIDFQVADVQHLPCADESFDAVIMNFGILHLSEPERALTEICRILTVGGRFAFTMWARPEEAKGFELVLRAIQTFGGAGVDIPPGPAFFNFSDPSYVEPLLARLGFSQIAAQQLPLVWVADSPDDIFNAFYLGAARTGGLLRRQNEQALLAIRNAVLEECLPFISETKVKIPMPAILYSAMKERLVVQA